MPDSNVLPKGQVPDGALGAILESITDGLIVVDRSWRYRYINRSAERLLARNRDELLGRTIWEAFPPLSNSDVEREYRRALKEGVSVHFEYYYDPLESWFDIRAYPSAQGLTIYLQVINERKAAVQTLQTRARQQAAVARMGLEVLGSGHVDRLLDDVVRVVAETLDVEYAKVLKLLPDRNELLLQAGVGWKPGSVGRVVIPGGENSQAGFTLRQREPVVVSDLQAETRFRGPALLLDHGVVSGMSVVIEGRDRPFGILAAHTRQRRTFSDDDANFLQAMANLLAEVVERQAMEAALRSSEEQFRELAENIREVLWMMTPGGELQYVNPAYETVWGRPVEGLYEDAISWQTAVHPDDRARVEAAYPGLSRGDFDVEFRIVRPDGSERWIHDRAFPVRDGNGRIVRVVGIAEDITERRLATENALRLAEERTALAAAQAAVRARDETLAVVSHDLRAPLQAILGAVAVLQEKELSPASRDHHLSVIERAVEGARRLLGDLLQVSSIEAGHVKLERNHVDVNRILQDVHEMFLDVARQREVRLRYERCRGVTAFADERRLSQVLTNLVDNALKHTPARGSVALKCTVRGDMVEVSVTDSGPGIPADVLPHVFEWYWRASHEQAAGAGIGLAVSRGIVEAHGGRIWAETEPGAGTTIRLTLPIVAEGTRHADLDAPLPRQVAGNVVEGSPP
ncbi:MAG: PAS domain S-box protein [Gemmatimonadota bacterium]